MAGQSYYLLATSDVTLPWPQWTRVATNLFGPGGSFSLTNALNPASPQQFYLIQAGGP